MTIQRLQYEKAQSYFESLQLPKILWGEHRQVMPRWWKVAQTAWDSGNWKHVEAEFAHVCASDFSSDLYVCKPTRAPLPGNLWRLYAIDESLLRLRQRSREQRVHLNRLHSLILDGMSRLWFVLGLLDGCCPTALISPGGLAWQQTRGHSQAYLAKLVAWLDELSVLTPRMRRHDAETDKLFAASRPHRRCELWWHILLDLLKDAGYRLELANVWTKYESDMTQTLLGEGIVRVRDGKYELVPRMESPD